MYLWTGICELQVVCSEYVTEMWMVAVNNLMMKIGLVNAFFAMWFEKRGKAGDLRQKMAGFVVDPDGEQ